MLSYDERENSFITLRPECIDKYYLLSECSYKCTDSTWYMYDTYFVRNFQMTIYLPRRWRSAFRFYWVHVYMYEPSLFMVENFSSCSVQLSMTFLLHIESKILKKIRLKTLRCCVHHANKCKNAINYCHFNI